MTEVLIYALITIAISLFIGMCFFMVKYTDEVAHCADVMRYNEQLENKVKELENKKDD